ncbi:Non-LTR retrotransposon CATS [Operophtera brumata]|uniref:ribonuclease H n=1 Tax=Operophtera brumata TaxID=104452 RepID=A0A0L7L848_OPEBR|nr:Non-LTR retrotransposon CATS [Operophtera brumata]
MARKGFSENYIPPGREVERKVPYRDNPHPSRQIAIDYECLENMEPENIESCHLSGPQVYTDGSKIEGKVGAALTWWDEGKEQRYSTFRLESHNTVFQSELYALYRAVRMVSEGEKESVNILSDSRSSLDLLRSPAITHPLAAGIMEYLRDIQTQGKRVRLFWLRAHVGTPGNERADELAKNAALKKKTLPDYSRVPISFVKGRIREESIVKWQARYDASSTGSVTKLFLPCVRAARKILFDGGFTPTHVQILTGHGGFASYLNRFKLKDYSSCACDPNLEETVWHLLCDCPRFGRDRMELEIEIQQKMEKPALWEILGGKKSRKPFLAFATKVALAAAIRNK